MRVIVGFEWNLNLPGSETKKKQAHTVSEYEFALNKRLINTYQSVVLLNILLRYFATADCVCLCF